MKRSHESTMYHTYTHAKPFNSTVYNLVNCLCFFLPRRHHRLPLPSCRCLHLHHHHPHHHHLLHREKKRFDACCSSFWPLGGALTKLFFWSNPSVIQWINSSCIPVTYTNVSEVTLYHKVVVVCFVACVCVCGCVNSCSLEYD